MKVMGLIEHAPWRGAVIYRDTWRMNTFSRVETVVPISGSTSQRLSAFWSFRPS